MKQHLTDLSRASLLGALLVTPAAAIPGSGEAPTAFDDAYTTTQDDNLSVDEPGVLGNDTDPEGDPLKAFLVDSSGATGNLILFEDGSLEYEVATGFVGIDTFSYVANDGTQDSAPATISFTVTPGDVLDPLAFVDEPTFLAAIAAQGWTTDEESFEDPLWPRSPTTVASVSNLGVTWTGNNPSSEVTTGPGPAIFGQYGFFELPHGDYTTGTDCNTPGNCTDGWIATADTGKFVAAGLWIHCNAGQAGIEFILDGDTVNTIDFDGYGLSAGSTGFFGVIDGNGFKTFEVHETEGKAEDASYIFADLFTFAFAAKPQVFPYDSVINVSPGSLSVTAGAPQIGTALALGIDNPAGTQAVGALPFLGLSSAPAPGFPRGRAVSGLGSMDPSSRGELLLSMIPPDPFLILTGPPWAGPGRPTSIALTIPAIPSLAGLSFFAQGALLDPTPDALIPLALTNALELRLGL